MNSYISIKNTFIASTLVSMATSILYKQAKERGMSEEEIALRVDRFCLVVQSFLFLAKNRKKALSRDFMEKTYKQITESIQDMPEIDQIGILPPTLYILADRVEGMWKGYQA